ncbi:MAG: DUF3581 domain-containing protein [Alteromonadaceae bacterium]|nr:DUF3581 domain-containing protein [Alteromonadaceae bacterium]
MFIDNFYNTSNGKISFSRQQASNFAKQVADDFNPLHNEDAKRFCVPGDLLFSVILAKSGLSKQMTFNFSGMVTDDIELTFPDEITDLAIIVDDNKKEYLSIDVAGETTKNIQLIESLTQAYVNFSGHTFPHLLVNLMAENNVMINPARPMIMYQSMSIDLHHFDVEEIELSLSKTTLTREGKRGNAWLEFDLKSNNEIIGQGKKHMLLSGLREYNQDNIDDIVNRYNKSKTDYIQHNNSKIS